MEYIPAKRMASLIPATDEDTNSNNFARACQLVFDKKNDLQGAHSPCCCWLVFDSSSTAISKSI